MTSRDVAFGRSLLKQIMEDVRKHTTPKQRKSVWTYSFGRDNWEVQSTGSNKVTPSRWYGRASSAYEARACFWAQWLEANKIR